MRSNNNFPLLPISTSKLTFSYFSCVRRHQTASMGGWGWVYVKQKVQTTQDRKAVTVNARCLRWGEVRGWGGGCHPSRASAATHVRSKRKRWWTRWFPVMFLLTRWHCRDLLMDYEWFLASSPPPSLPKLLLNKCIEKRCWKRMRSNETTKLKLLLNSF